MKDYLQRRLQSARQWVEQLTRSMPDSLVPWEFSRSVGGFAYSFARALGMALILAILPGCSTFSGETIQPDGTKTSVKAGTFWDSQSALAKGVSKVTKTGASVGVDGLNQESSSSNAVHLFQLGADGALRALKP